MRSGSVITFDNGIKALALAAETYVKYKRDIFPLPLEHLQTIQPKDIAQHIEPILSVVTAENKTAFTETLTKRIRRPQSYPGYSG